MLTTSCEDILGHWEKPVAPEEAPTIPTASISFAAAELTRGSADPAFTLTLENTGDGSVVFESSNGDVATVDAATGKVTLKGAGHTGTTTITATVANTDNYNYPTNTATCALTVEDGYSYLEWDGTKMATKIVADDDANRVLVTNTTTTLDQNSKVYVVNGDVDISANVSYTGSEANNAKVVLCDGAKLKINGGLYGSSASNYISIYGQSEGEDMGELSIEDNSNSSAVSGTDIKIYGGKISVTS